MKTAIILLCAIAVSLTSCRDNPQKKKYEVNPEIAVSLTSYSDKPRQKKSDKPRQKKYEVNPYCVYVCSGHSAKRFHSVSNCKGLAKCSGRILEMSVDEAEYKGKTPCKICVKQ